jgi:hypothetical protein
VSQFILGLVTRSGLWYEKLFERYKTYFLSKSKVPKCK